jgi:hypothetical protein
VGVSLSPSPQHHGLGESWGHKKVNNYLLSMGRLAVHQFIMEKYITPFTFTDLKL